MTAAPPPWRTFVAKRLDRERWWPISTNAGDEEIDDVLREDGFDPFTRREVTCSSETPEVGRGDDEDGSSLVRHRWVRIMADVYADGVWNQDGESCLVDDLPITPDLRARILAWQDWYDRDYDREERPFDRPAFAVEGLAIARAVKTQLPDWTVVYFDESKPTWQQPRSTFDYEIGLPENDGPAA